MVVDVLHLGPLDVSAWVGRFPNELQRTSGTLWVPREDASTYGEEYSCGN